MLALLVRLKCLTCSGRARGIRVPGRRVGQRFSEAVEKIEQGRAVRHIHRDSRVVSSAMRVGTSTMTTRVRGVRARRAATLFCGGRRTLQDIVGLTCFDCHSCCLGFRRLPSNGNCTSVMCFPGGASGLPTLMIRVG